jgi:hypothetical protein
MATKEDSDRLRDNVRDAWRKKFHFDVPPEQVNCNGCKSGGRKFFICKLCPVEKCVLEKGLDSCTLCADCACEKLRPLMAVTPNQHKSVEMLK